MLAITLLIPIAAAQVEKPDPSTRYQKLLDEVKADQARHQKEQMDKFKKWNEAGKEGPAPAFMMRAPIDEFITKFRKAAKDYGGTDDCVRFHVWVVEYALRTDEDAALQSLDVVMAKHITSKDLGGVARALPQYVGHLQRDGVADHFDRILEKNPHAPVQALALYHRAKSAANRVRVGSEDWRVVKKELLRAKKLTDDQDLARQIQSLITDRENLRVGGMAPEIKGKDLDGVAFKLSDYRGKIVVLDFWGHW
ncbi:MAG: hypothetical protein CMJ83_18805 [Planctomycetes bacterium]|nr:hypothetical protein [Planctomycetota bacterium]